MRSREAHVLLALDDLAHHERLLTRLLQRGEHAGNWRDSEDGLGGGRYPYDVNGVFVPAAQATLRPVDGMFVSFGSPPTADASEGRTLPPRTTSRRPTWGVPFTRDGLVIATGLAS